LLDKKVPNWISSNNKHFFSFLAGFTDAEGNIGVYSNRAMFQIGNYDKKILSFIANKLNKTKIVCNGPYESDTSGYFNSDGFGHNQNYFQIRVNRKDSLMELFKELKPYIKHELKVKALNRAIENIKMRNERYDR
jgi:hypothetical protein